jgi:hypothetical protein
MVFQPRTGASNPIWNRDEKEYEDLNIIEDSVRLYSHTLRANVDLNGNKMNANGWILELRSYTAAINNYFKWLKPYLLKFHEENKVDKIQALLEFCDDLQVEGERLKEFTSMPKAYMDMFSILERVENMLKSLKVEHNMGVRVEYIMDEKDLERQRLNNRFQ